MRGIKSRKGISPLIAAVLLIAFTMAVAGMFSQWAPSLIQGIQEDTSEDAVNIAHASNLGLEIMGVEFNRSSNQIEVLVQNTGESIDNKTNISVAVVGGSVANTEQHNADLSEKEITTISVPVDRTYPLETLQVSMTNYPVSDESSIKCTPTSGLVGYWSFNQDQTKNGWAVDLSGYGNNGSISGTSTDSGRVGEAYSFDGSSSVDIPDNVLPSASNPDRTIFLWFNPEPQGTDSLTNQNDIFRGTLNFGFSTAKDFNQSGDVSLWNNWYTENTTTAPIESDVEVGRWNSLTARYDYNSSYTETSLFHNSAFEGSRINSSGFSEGSGDLIIGDGWGGPLIGMLDEVRIYNRSLSQAEIQRLNQVRSEDWAVDACKLTA